MFDDSVVLIEKPAGETSFETMKKVQRALGVKKAGHCGTLDRFASGLLVVTTGKASRISQFLLESDKSYRAVIALGLDSPSHDPETEITEVPVPEGAFDRLENLLQLFEGKQDQLPPVYSALKIKGKRASDRVRAGEEVELKSRPITIYSLRLLSVDTERNLFEVDVVCSKGTYIRSLARDIGARLGTAAILKSLVRTASGSFSLGDALPVSQLSGETGRRCVRTIEEALVNLTSVEVSEFAVQKIAHGAQFSREEIVSTTMRDSEMCALVHKGSVCAIAVVDFGHWAVRYSAVFCQNTRSDYSHQV